MSSLFDRLSLGDLELPNRIIMAPLTRSRAGVSRIPNVLMAEYYAQRAGFDGVELHAANGYLLDWK